MYILIAHIIFQIMSDKKGPRYYGSIDRQGTVIPFILNFTFQTIPFHRLSFLSFLRKIPLGGGLALTILFSRMVMRILTVIVLPLLFKDAAWELLVFVLRLIARSLIHWWKKRLRCSWKLKFTLMWVISIFYTLESQTCFQINCKLFKSYICTKNPHYPCMT